MRTDNQKQCKLALFTISDKKIFEFLPACSKNVISNGRRHLLVLLVRMCGWGGWTQKKKSLGERWRCALFQEVFFCLYCSFAVPFYLFWKVLPTLKKSIIDESVRVRDHLLQKVLQRKLIIKRGFSLLCIHFNFVNHQLLQTLTD